MDCMERYVSQVDASLVVMGSNQLTSSVFDYVMGSVTVSCCKRLQVGGWVAGGRAAGGWLGGWV